MTILLWIGFLVFILGMLALDLGVFHRRSHVVGTAEALVWTAVWVVMSLTFNVAVYAFYEHHLFGIGRDVGHELGGHDAALQFFTGYLIEKSLSLDNVFVIALIFAWFHVPAILQHRVLFWGVMGALVMRGAMIGLGAALIQTFSWTTYLFGGILLLSAVKMLLASDERIEPDRNPIVRLTRRFYPVTSEYQGERFFTRLPDGRRAVTPLFLVLIVVENTDLLFAVDSIPAIFSITYDPFLVFTSNVFAILGLRSLYFALAALIDRFRYLKASLVFVLAFVGVKMILAHHYEMSAGASLAIIAGILGVGAFASVVAGRRAAAAHPAPVPAPAPRSSAPLAPPRALLGPTLLLLAATGSLLLSASLILPVPPLWILAGGFVLLLLEAWWLRWVLRQASGLPAP